MSGHSADFALTVPTPDPRGRCQPVRTGLQLLTEKIPLLLLSIADGLITIVAQRSQGAMESWDQFPMFRRAGYTIQGYGWYLWTTCCPSGLTVYYAFKPLVLLYVCVSALVLITISLYVVRHKERGHLLFGWLWFVLALLPVSGLLQVGDQSHADRYSYVPHIGLFVACVWEVQHWLEKWSVARHLAKVTAVATIAICMVLSNSQIRFWSNSETLWAHALQLDPDNHKAHTNLGVLRLQQHNYEDAETHLRRAVAVRPAWGVAIANLGWLHVQRQEWDQADECFAWALRADPKSVNARSGLAQVRALRPAASVLERKARQVPDEAVVANRLGLTHARRGEFEAALRQFREAIAIAPEYGDAHNNAALALSQLKQIPDAERHFRLALKYDPGNRNFHVNLALLLESQKNWEEARKHYERALQLHPHDVEARQRLDRLLKYLGTL